MSASNATQSMSVLRRDLSPGVVEVRLNRPDRRNAFDAQTIAALTAMFKEIANDRAVRCVLLRGEGKVFCAGADADWMRAAARQDKAANLADARQLAEMLRTVYEAPQLTVALVHGAAIGGGAGLVAACDVAVAVKGTKFRFTEILLGLTPATISPFVMDAIGPSRARALFATAEGFDADYAEQIGLVHFVVDDETRLDEEGARQVGQCLAAAPGAVADAKALVRELTGRRISADLDFETAQRIAARRASDEGREGLAAFIEKRKPNWVVE